MKILALDSSGLVASVRMEIAARSGRVWKMKL